MKNLSLFICLALGLVACQPEKVVVWDNPSSVQNSEGGRYKVTKVELKESETILHIDMYYYGRQWYKFTREAVLHTDDGKEYALTNCAKTCDEESDVQLDSIYHTPNYGRTKIALHFEPLPLDTRRMHMIKSSRFGATRLMNICDATTFVAPEWPSDWQNLQYDPNETLPTPQIKEGVATLRIKILDYHPKLDWSLIIDTYKILGAERPNYSHYYFDDEGNITAEIPMKTPHEVQIRVGDILDHFIVLAPGQETSILLRAAEDESGLLAFKGYLAKTNMDLVRGDNSYTDFYLRYGVLDSLDNCYTPEERVECLISLLNKRISDIQSSDYTPAAKELLCMSAEMTYMRWFCYFSSEYINNLQLYGKLRLDSYLRSRIGSRTRELLPDDTPNPYTYQYLNRSSAPVSHNFWALSYKNVKEMNLSQFNMDLWRTENLIYYRPATAQEVALIHDPACRKILQDLIAKENDLTRKIKPYKNLHYNEYDNLSAEDMYETLSGKHKGKPIIVYLWHDGDDTRSGELSKLASRLERLMNQRVPLITVASNSFKAEKWFHSVKYLRAEHYYLTAAQFNYLQKRYETDSLPTCIIFDSEGNRAYSKVGNLNLAEIVSVLNKL